MSKLTAVVIGCGKIALSHLDALRSLQNVQVAGVCDLSPSRAEATAERFGVEKWFADYRTMLSEIRPDLVHITTPPFSHFEIAEHCLSAGLNVLCEKPIVINYPDFEALKKLAVTNRCLLMENQNLRFHRSIQRLLGLIKSGEFGDVLDLQLCFSIDIVGGDTPYTDPNVAHWGTALPGGVIGDWLPHMAYTAYAFIGPVLDLRTMWRNHLIDSKLPPEEFRSVLKGERATAYLSFSGNSRPDGYWVRVSGTQMYAEANLLEPGRVTTRRARTGEPAMARLVDGCVEARDVLSGTVASFWDKLGGKVGDDLRALIAETYLSLASHGPPPISLAEIENTTQLVHNLTAAEFRI